MNKERRYFIGVTLNFPKKTVATFHLSGCLDGLPCELVEYYGEFITTKKHVYSQRKLLLKELQKKRPYLKSVKIN